MMKRKWLWLPTAAVALTMAACGSKTTTTTTTTEGADKSKFVSEVTHDGEPIKGGTLKYAIVSSSPLNGVFIDELSQDSTDSSVAGMIDESMFEYDDNRKLVNSGLASISFDVEGKTATVKLNSQDYKWSDGEKVTIDDYIFAYEGIGHKDYTGVRYDGDYKNIEGMEEYHKGSASTISGLEKLDDYTVKIHYKEMTPSMQLAGGAVSSYIMPKHVFSKIPVAEWEQSDAVRGKSNVGLGAFTIESMVPGESVTMVANPNYFKGRPNIDKVVMEVVSPDSIVSEMKAGKYDIASMPRQAIAYAIDPDTAGKNLYNGLQHGTNSIIIPFFKDIYNKDQEGFDYNPEKAKKILDDAGYKDVDGDGLRENKDGSKLKINFAARTRDDANESLIQQYLLWWKEVGLDVQLLSGRTIELNSFYDKVQADDPEIDMFTAGWSTGYDPNPEGLFGEAAKFNFQRYSSAEGNAIIEKISSNEAFDNSKNIQFYKEWQKYVHDNAFIFPTITGEKVTAVNKRVKYFDTKLGSNNDKSSMVKLQLTANEPVK